jgi:type II secretory pathway component GspD/PulD (secretin)
MRALRRHLLFVCFTVAVALAADQPATIATVPCIDGIAGANACSASKKDLRSAKEAFTRGLKLEKSQQLNDALEQFQEASHLVPQNVEYATAREVVLQRLVYDHVQRGNTALSAGRDIEAQAEFASALDLDPSNEFARERLTEALGPDPSRLPATVQVTASEDEIRLEPLDQRADFHFTGDSKELLAQIAKVFGIEATVEDSVVSRRVNFNIQNVDFETAMQAASVVTKTFWAPLDSRKIVIALDSPENHRLYDRMAMRSFFVPDYTTPQELNDLANVLRGLFEIRYLGMAPLESTLEIRAPKQTVEAATRFIERLDTSRPEVTLEVQAFEVSHQMTRAMGIHIPNEFKLFNIPVAALAALGGQNIQDLINQLISGGGINQANNSSISALLAQLQNQQNSIFSQPVATFGGGLTLMGLSLDQLSAQLSLNENWVRNLENATLRTSQGKDATLHIGTKYPILNASFAPIFNTPAISQVIQNNSFTAAFPSFSYEDLGLNVKVKPAIHDDEDVSLQLELQFRALGAQSLNGVPVIQNREYKGSILLSDGEPAVVAGMVSRTDQKSLSGIPGLASVAGLNKIVTTNTKEEDSDELLIVITPHINRMAEHTPSEIWLAGNP